jgi:hypothetical protein
MSSDMKGDEDHKTHNFLGYSVVCNIVSEEKVASIERSEVVGYNVGD